VQLFFRLTGLFLFSCLLLSCSNQTPDSPDSDFTVILITDVGGLGDKGFNDSGWMGCQDAQKRLKEKGVDVSINVIESREQTDYNDNLTLAAEKADVVVALGFLILDNVKQIAPHYPDTSFVFIDGVIEANNVASFTFRANEGGFLASILASYITRTGIIAVMPGMDIPPVEAYAAGYRAGAKMPLCGHKDMQVLSSTVGSFNDPVKAKSLAQSLYNQNADIILQLCGNSGLGVIEAGRDASEGKYIIGADINQDALEPGKILVSILKRMDLVVSDQITAAYDGTIKYGHMDVGLKEGYVSLSDMQYTKDMIPDDAMQAVEKAKQMVIDGTVKVPSTYQEAEAFGPPAVN
jgi:basic membrane protein A